MNGKTMLVAVLAAAAVAAGAARPAAADDDVACARADESALAAIGCDETEPEAPNGPKTDDGKPRFCRYRSDVVFYAQTDWLRLARSLAADASACADFHVTIPPTAADKTRLRPVEAKRVDDLGPNVYPLAEIHTGGWAGWVSRNRSTWYAAGVEARTRLLAAGFETWALNEVSDAVRRGTADERANLAQFILGLYGGDGPKLTGVVFVAGPSQTAPGESYKSDLSGWLLDSLFWSTISDAVRTWGQEVYGDARVWAVPGASRHERTSHLAEYLMHGLELAEAAPDGASAARDLLRRTYVPITNEAWPWPSAYGFTDVPVELMQSYVSEEVYAVRSYAGSHPHSAPGGGFGGAWAPRAVNGKIDAVATQAILDRVASALHEAYEEGGGSPMGACGRPGEHDWCTGELPGAAFVETWSGFSTF